MALGITRRQLAAAMADQGYVVTNAQAERDYEAVLREWSADGEQNRVTSRAAAVARLTADLALLRREACTASTARGPSHTARAAYWRAVEAHEALLARILGLYAPVMVQARRGQAFGFPTPSMGGSVASRDGSEPPLDCSGCRCRPPRLQVATRRG